MPWRTIHADLTNVPGRAHQVAEELDFLATSSDEFWMEAYGYAHPGRVAYDPTSAFDSERCRCHGQHIAAAFDDLP